MKKVKKLIVFGVHNLIVGNDCDEGRLISVDITSPPKIISIFTNNIKPYVAIVKPLIIAIGSKNHYTTHETP